MSANNDLTPQQMAQLSEVFRSEAVEHIKGIAEVLFSVEDRSIENMEDGLNRAFRDAHSLKGSAGTLGFNRVAVLAHRFEDALGSVRAHRIELGRKQLEALLQALEAIRQAVFNSTPDDSQLSDREHAVAAGLNAAFSLPDGLQVPAARETAEAAPSPKVPPPSPKIQDRAPASHRGDKQELVRVSEKRIDQVITQFGELFETSLQIESLGHDLNTNLHEADRLSAGLSTLLDRLDGTPFEAEAMELLDMARNLSILAKSAAAKFDVNHRELTKHIARSQEALRELRIAPISSLHLTLRNQVRETAGTTGKQVVLQMTGGEYAIDRAILDAIEKPMIHLIRNAIDHGIESPKERAAAGKPPTGELRIDAHHMGDAVSLTISDDGRGIDVDRVRASLVTNYGVEQARANELTTEQLFDYLFEPGFTTSAEISQISGRGVGLDVVKYTIEHLGGEVSMQSTVGSGTTILLRLPLTMSSVKCLLFESARQTMAVPASNVSRVMVIPAGAIRTVGGGDIIDVGDEQVPLTTFEEVLGLAGEEGVDHQKTKFAAVIRFGDRRYAFGFDVIHEYTQLVVKPLGDLLERVPNVSGLALLGTGRLCLILNPGDLIRSATGTIAASSSMAAIHATRRASTILVIDDSIAIRTMQQTLLESEGFKVLTAADGLKALQMLGNHQVDLVLSDVQMPNMDGFELTRAIKSRDRTKKLPVVLITSLGSEDDIAAGLQAGADAHIVKKELTRSELLKTINQLL